MVDDMGSIFRFDHSIIDLHHRNAHTTPATGRAFQKSPVPGRSAQVEQAGSTHLVQNEWSLGRIACTECEAYRSETVVG